MSILVAGGAGFIGYNFIKKLSSRNKKIFVLDNFSNSSFNIKKSVNNNISIFKCNLANASETNSIINKIIKYSDSNPEVWHFAANSDIQAGIHNPKIDLDNTFLSTYNLLECCKKYEIKSFYFASSSAVYGDHFLRKIKESDGPLMPISNYGAMKLASEGICFASYENFLDKLRVFRFPNVVGSPATHGVIYDFINKLKRTPNQLKVLGNGTQKKSYIHVDDLIEGMIFLSNDIFNLGQNPIYNIGQVDDPVSVSWIAEETIKIASPKAKIIYGKENRGWLGDIPKFKYDTKKTFNCGWKPKLNSKESIKKAILEIFNQLK